MKRVTIIALAFAGVLAACGGAIEEGAPAPTITVAESHEGRDQAIHDAAGSGSTVTTEAPTTTLAPTTTVAPTTTEAVEAAPVAGKGGAPKDPLAVYAATYYETQPYGQDLSCEGLHRDITTSEVMFSAADWPFVEQAIIARAEKEGCPIS